MTKKLNTKNSKILHETMVTLGALKEESDALQKMEINEIKVGLIDEHGDGIILCLEYDEHGELSKTFSTMEEYYEDYEEIEVELEDDACNSPENKKSEEKSSFIEETISEEYDEIFHSASARKKLPSLLN